MKLSITGDCDCIHYFKSDGFCDIENNNELCDFDGGDCQCIEPLLGKAVGVVNLINLILLYI